MKKIVLVVLAICTAAIFVGCSKEAEREAYASCGYEALTGCWVREYEEDHVKKCEAVQFFSDGKMILGYTDSTQSSVDRLIRGYYTEKDGTLRIDREKNGAFTIDELLHYTLTRDKLTITNGEESRVFRRWDKDINFIKELCPKDSH